MQYSILHNVDARFSRAYRPGDRLIAGHVGRLDAPLDAEAAAEMVFMLHNRDDRPDRSDAPSLSMGDVVVFDAGTWSVAALGFERVEVTEGSVLPGPYRERIAALEERSG